MRQGEDGEGFLVGGDNLGLKTGVVNAHKVNVVSGEEGSGYSEVHSRHKIQKGMQGITLCMLAGDEL